MWNSILRVTLNSPTSPLYYNLYSICFYKAGHGDFPKERIKVKNTNITYPFETACYKLFYQHRTTTVPFPMIKALAVLSVNNFQQQTEIRKLCEICCACFALPNSHMPAYSYDTEHLDIRGTLKILELNKNTNMRKRIVHPHLQFQT